MKRRPKRLSLAAFTLVEVTMALGVAAFCLLTILALLQTGLMSEKDTVGRTEALGILTSVYADLAATSSVSSSSEKFGIVLTNQSLATPQTLYFLRSGEPSGSIGSTPNADSLYRVSVGIQSPPANSSAPATVRLLATWPALADPAPEVWPSKASGNVEIVTALSRH